MAEGGGFLGGITGIGCLLIIFRKFADWVSDMAREATRETLESESTRDSIRLQVRREILSDSFTNMVRQTARAEARNAALEEVRDHGWLQRQV